MVQYPRHVRRNYAVAIALIAFGASFVANAQGAAGNIAGTTTEIEGEKVPWRGSSITYGHSATATTFAPDGLPDAQHQITGEATYQYNPTWAHNLTLVPEWHFNDLFFVRARLFISQEFTASDFTQGRNIVEFSDTFIDFGTTGYKEKVTGIRLSGDVRVTLPSSRLSQMRGQLFTIGPAAVLSRGFPVLSGLALIYVARGNLRVNNSSGGHAPEGRSAGCANDNLTTACEELRSTGMRNGFFDFTHGPAVSFQPHSTVSIDLSIAWTRLWLYGLTPAPAEIQSEALSKQEQNDGRVRDFTRFVASVSWQFSRPVGVSLTAFTIGPSLNASGRYDFPLFNRNTTFYLDATVDIEAITSKLFPKKS